MPAIVVPGKENAGSFLRVPLLARGADQKTDARASRTAFPRWSVGTIKNALLRIWPFYGAIKFVVLVVRPGKVAYSSGCEARPGRSSQPLGSESLDRTG